MTPKANLPTVALVYGRDSVNAFDLAEAATGCCRIIWVLLDDPPMARLLPRLGTVVDITSLTDSDAVTSLRRLAPDGIVTFADSHLCRTAMLAEGLGLPFLSPEVAAVVADKRHQREAMERAGLPGPRVWVIGPGDVAPRDVTGELPFPLVVKPSEGAASRETSLVVDHEQLLDAVARARMSGYGAMVAEEYLPDADDSPDAEYASFVSVDSVAGGGRIRHLAVMGKLPIAPPFRETGHFTPSHLPEETVRDVLDIVTAAIRALGIVVGALHTEVKLTPAGLRIIEVNGRTGGAMPAILAAAGGCSLIESAMRIALGETPSDAGLSPCDRVGFKINVQPPKWAHTVRAVEGLEALEAVPGVRSVTLNRKAGDTVDWRRGTDDMIFSVIGAVDDLAGLRRVRQQVDQLVSVVYA